MSDFKNNSHFNKFMRFVYDRSLSRTNRYLVEITGPSNSEAKINDDISNYDLSLMCDYVSHPAFTIHTKDAAFYGASDMRPDGGLDFHNVTGMSFLLDEEQRVKSYFTNWMDLIIDKKSYFVNYPAKYIANTIKIHQLDMADNITYTTVLYDVYPIEIGSVDASSQAGNQFSRLNVQFNFRTWEGFVKNSDADKNKQKTQFVNTINNTLITNIKI